MSLQIYQDPNRNLMLLQTSWSQQLNPVLANTILQGIQINNIKLVANTPQTINHLLSRQIQGWLVVDQNAAAIIYRTQPFNSQTITLESSANVTVNIWCY